MKYSIKVSILIIALILPIGMLSANPMEHPLHLQVNAQVKRELFIQDWIQLNKSPWNTTFSGSYSPSVPALEPIRIIQQAKQGLAMNAKEMERLKSLNMQTIAYQKLVALKIKNAQYQQQILHQIIRQTETARPQVVKTTGLLQGTLKVRALEQKYELKILKYFLKNFLVNTNSELSTVAIDNTTFHDWINYKILMHQLNPVPALPFNPQIFLEETAKHSVKQDIRAYQQLEPQTEFFKDLISQQIKSLQQNEQLFAEIPSHPASVHQAKKNLEKLQQVLSSSEFKKSIEDEQNIKYQEQLIDRQILNALEQYYAN